MSRLLAAVVQVEAHDERIQVVRIDRLAKSIDQHRLPPVLVSGRLEDPAPVACEPPPDERTLRGRAIGRAISQGGRRSITVT